MTRSVPSGLADILAQSPRKGAECVVLERADGTRVAFTTWDRPLTIDLGIGAGEDVCAPGLVHSAVSVGLGMDAGNFEMSGAIGAVVTRAAVLGGVWRNARAWLTWTSPSLDAPLPVVPLLCGKVADCRLEDGRWIFEVRDHGDAFNQVIGRVLSPYCTHDFGDALCTVVRTAYPAEVTAVTSAYQIAVDIDPADHFFDQGTVLFTSGVLTGVEAEVFRNDGGALELYTGLLGLPSPGDTVTLYRGCSKLLMSDDAAVPTCLSYANVINFGGHPEVPGTEKYMKVAEPGQGGGGGFFRASIGGGSGGGGGIGGGG